MKQIRALEDVRDTLSAEEQRRINLQHDDEALEGKRGEVEDLWEDNTPPASPRLVEEDEPYWGEHMLEREPGIEMQALGGEAPWDSTGKALESLGAEAEAPFGANVSRVLKVGKKFAPKVVARMEQMSENAIKKLGWVSEVLEDTTAFVVKAGTWATELGIGATIGKGMQMLGVPVGGNLARLYGRECRRLD